MRIAEQINFNLFRNSHVPPSKQNYFNSLEKPIVNPIVNERPAVGAG